MLVYLGCRRTSILDFKQEHVTINRKLHYGDWAWIKKSDVLHPYKKMIVRLLINLYMLACLVFSLRIIVSLFKLLFVFSVRRVSLLFLSSEREGEFLTHTTMLSWAFEFKTTDIQIKIIFH